MRPPSAVQSALNGQRGCVQVAGLHQTHGFLHGAIHVDVHLFPLFQ
jgi:hypothetical protein